MSSAAMDIMSNKMKRDRWLGYFGRLLIVFLALAFAFFPVIWIASASLNETGTLNTQKLIPTKAGLENYRTLLDSDVHPFATWMWNSIKVSVITAVLTVFVCALGAYAFSRFRFAGRRFTLNTYRDGERLEGVQFAAPVTVTLAYTDAEVEGLDESTLVLYTWDGSSWVDAATSCSPASTYLREPEENRLSVGICHLSEFAVFGQPERVPQGHFALALPLVKR